jgi:uncharacterized protein (TIGR03790 family)
LLANSDDPDSVRIAEHYAAQRDVPRENIIALSMPQAETIDWPEFVTTIWQPLQDELIRRKWIDAIPMALVDEVGRKKSVINGHRISTSLSAGACRCASHILRRWRRSWCRLSGLSCARMQGRWIPSLAC